MPRRKRTGLTRLGRYLVGHREEAAFVERLCERFGVPAVASCAAAATALRAHDIEHVQLVHPPWFDDEFDHLGVRFVSVQDQVDTSSPMGRAMFTIIGAMAELESALISERVTAGMKAAQNRGRRIGRPPVPQRIVGKIEALAASTSLSVRQIHTEIAGKASRGVVGEITRRVRADAPPAL